MVLERANRLLRHRVHRARPDQLLHVHDVAVRRVFGRSGRPETALRVGALRSELLPALTGEDALVVLVGELRVRNRELALQLGMTDLVEATVRLRVDARDEERRNALNLRNVAARRGE